MEQVGYDSAFTFVFSPRRGTEAAELTEGLVPHEVKVERMERLVEVVQRRARERAQRFVGRTVEVLVEGPSRTDPERLRGRTRHNKVVNFTGLAAPGELAEVEITAATSQTLSGEERLLARGGELSQGFRGRGDASPPRGLALDVGLGLALPEPGATGALAPGADHPDRSSPSWNPIRSWSCRSSLSPCSDTEPLPGVRAGFGRRSRLRAGEGVDGVAEWTWWMSMSWVVPSAASSPSRRRGAAPLAELGAAAAPAMPETAPPAASAPATIVAPSSLDVFMRSNLLGRLTG